MKRLIDRGQGLHVIAAAVLVALGGSQAAAQQAGQPGADRPETQQPQQQQSQRQDPLSTEQSQREDPFSTERQSQDAASQDPSLDSASQRAGQESEQESSRSAAADSGSAGGSAQLDQIAQQHDDLSTFIEAVKAAGMEQSLTGSTEYTVFAPTNEAFEQMSGMSVEELMRAENREQLISLLRAHIVADDVDENMARSLQQAQTIDGGTVDLSASGDELQVGDATVVETGIQEGNLRIYAIDQVLEPTAVARAEPGSESQSQSESQLDLGSERESGVELETERESGSELDTQSERESGSQLERDDPFGSESRPGAQQPAPGVPGADRPGESTDRSGAQPSPDRL